MGEKRKEKYLVRRTGYKILEYPNMSLKVVFNCKEVDIKLNIIQNHEKKINLIKNRVSLFIQHQKDWKLYQWKRCVGNSKYQ